jgi:hypothetical protein
MLTWAMPLRTLETCAKVLLIVGGPGNSLDRNLNYKIEKDICDIAQKTSSTNVKFVGLLWWHDKP